MTDPVVRLDPTRLMVEPGGQARVTVTVYNPSTIVEGYRLEVLGEGVRDWAEVVPPEVRVLPHREATAVVVMSPPAGTAAPNSVVPFGVLVTSTVDPSASAAEEGDLDVGRVHGMQAKLSPVTSNGRWSGRHALEVRNWGNAPARLRLLPNDPDRRIGFLIYPEQLDVPVGGSATAAVRVRSRRPFLRGAPVRLPFQIVGEPFGAAAQFGPPGPAAVMASPERPVLDGAFQQRPILSRASVIAAVLVIAAAVALVWFTLATREPERLTAVNAALPLPQEVHAEARTASTVHVSWKQEERPETYVLYTIEPGSGADAVPSTIAKQPVDGELNQADVVGLDPATNHCFQLVAIQAKRQSLRTAPVCAETPSAPPPPTSTTGGETSDPGPSDSTSTSEPTTTTPTTTTPPPTTQPPGSDLGPLDPEEWIIFDIATFAGEGDAHSIEERNRLQAEGLTAGVLLSTQYPDIYAEPNFYLVYVRTEFKDQNMAMAYCTTIAEVLRIEKCSADTIRLPGLKIVE